MKKSLLAIVAAFSFATVMFIGANEAQAYVQTKSAGLNGVIYVKKPLVFQAGNMPKGSQLNNYLGLKVNGREVPADFTQDTLWFDLPFFNNVPGTYNRVTFVSSYGRGVFYNEVPVKIYASANNDPQLKLEEAKNKALDGIQDLYNNGYISYNVFLTNHMAIKNAKTVSTVERIYNRLYDLVVSNQ